MPGRKAWSIGSRWLRWDPHLHAPGTLRNNQYGDDWDSYLTALESAQPAPVALGITDYFTLRTYKEVLSRRERGALAGIPLVFANIELRLTVETKSRSGINLHLLISPDDPHHVALIQEKLARLTFPHRSDNIPLSDDGLIRLGRAHKGDPNLPEAAAISEGANQFKVDLGQLRNLYDGDSWIRSNVLVAVAAGNDGIGGLSKDASFHAQREEIARFSQIVFSSNAKDREYWLGKHPGFLADGQTPKPCLHGSDAHRIEDVLQPEDERRCWIRAEPSFDGLRQAIVEPERRVHIGDQPPRQASPSNVIESLGVLNAPWFENGEVRFNDGLVTIIGAKGSGKTALADLIACAGASQDRDPGPASFLAKASSLLATTKVKIVWSDGDQQSCHVVDRARRSSEPRVRYLSQQFVERLCSPTGLAASLVEEIENVVFSSIPEEDQLQCGSFVDLRSVVLKQPISERNREQESIRAIAKQIADETALIKSLDDLRSKGSEAVRARAVLEQELGEVSVKSLDGTVGAQKIAADAVARLKTAIAQEERRANDLGDIIAEIERLAHQAAADLEAVRFRFSDVLAPEHWKLIKIKLSSKALPILSELKSEAEARAKRLRETGVSDALSADEVQKAVGLAALVAESERLTKELGLDRAAQKRRGELEKKLRDARKRESETAVAVAHAEKASARRDVAQVARLTKYEKVFDALSAEERALERLYEPMMSRIDGDHRLEKLSFSIQRVVLLDEWAERGEALVDLRRPPFQRKGALIEAARTTLLTAWQKGTPQQVRSSMDRFVRDYATAAMDSLALGVSAVDFGEWLFSTDHIRVQYSIQYEGVELTHLSPGTRGVVLLTLFLALDEWDDRPLVIDQPEENLDPRSIYADLVPFFRDAARRRQIIMVTHNANLVVNTDSDQVIVAEAERVSPGELPRIRYVAGGLEDPTIREHVCRLLEGGDEAFRKRGLRYGSGARLI